MKESDRMRLIQVALTKEGLRMFRNNTALGWAGTAIRVTKPTKLILLPSDVVVRDAYPLHAGLCDGSSDLIGISPSGKFVACEAKSESGRLTKSQKNFIDFILSYNGIAFKATTPEEAVSEYRRQL